MCGIVGVCYFDRERRVAEEDLAAMAGRIVHRGPDDEGTVVFGNVGLGMRRLSIIDLAGGHQPIFSPSGKQAIVFNGEAYNYREQGAALEAKGHTLATRSDTEVVLHLFLEHGDTFTRHLNGMFGLAIWDNERRRLVVARDRVGIKPVYYYRDDEKLVFGSEIKSILAFPGVSCELNVDALPLYLKYGFTPVPHTLFRNVHKLPPGHLMTVEDGDVRVTEYWDVSYAEKTEAAPEAIAEELYELLCSSVRYRMIADVPLGAFLSGGLDSTSIVHMMNEVGSGRVQTYNIGYGQAYAEHDESSDARAMAHHYGTDHHEILADADVRDLFPRLVGHMDEPIADSSFVVTYLVSRLASETVKVILSGVGGDELFGGYRRYLNVGLGRIWHAIPASVRRHALMPLLGALPADRNHRVLNYFRLAKGFAESAELPPTEQYESMITVMSTDVIAATCRSRSEDADPYAALVGHCDGKDALDRIMYVDLKTSLAEQLLLLTDKMSMACSLEARVPYLDHRVVEFAARIPARHKVRGRSLRDIQKRTFRGRVPDEVLSRRKRGFGAPVGAWLRGDLAEMIGDYLGETKLARDGIFDAGAVHHLITEHGARRIDGTDALLALLTFQLWHEEYLEGVHAPGRTN